MKDISLILNKLAGSQDKMQEPGDTVSVCIVILGLLVNVRKSRDLRGKGAAEILPRRNYCAPWQNQRFLLLVNIGTEFVFNLHGPKFLMHVISR
jgi:hypothetical protein